MYLGILGVDPEGVLAGMCPLDSANSVMIIALGLDDMYDEVKVYKHHNVDCMEGDRVVAGSLSQQERKSSHDTTEKFIAEEQG